MQKSDINILIVDDNVELRTIIRDYLKEDGYVKLHVSENGLSALRKAKSDPPGLIIAEYDLPGLDGLELLKEVRKDNSLADTPFIMISSESQQKYVAQSAEFGVTGFVVKPFSHQTLSDKVALALRRTLNPSDSDVKYEEANRLVMEGDLDGALEKYQEALLATRGAMAAIHYKIGRVHEAQGKDSEADNDYNEAIAMSDLFVDAYDALGAMRLKENQVKEALELLHHSAGISPLNAKRQLYYGEALLESGDFAGAEKAFKLSLDLDPTQTHVFNRIGITLRRQGKTEEAVQFLLRAIEVTDDDENLFYNISRAYLDLDNKEEAVKYLKRAIEINPDFHEARDLMVNLDV